MFPFRTSPILLYHLKNFYINTTISTIDEKPTVFWSEIPPYKQGNYWSHDLIKLVCNKQFICLAASGILGLHISAPHSLLTVADNKTMASQVTAKPLPLSNFFGQCIASIYLLIQHRLG